MNTQTKSNSPLTGKCFVKPDENGNIIKEVELAFSKKYQMWIRPDSSDKMMLKESAGDYPKIVCTDKVVLDLGANIGGFTKLALEQGCKKVIAYEPDEFNFDMLDLNINDDRAELIKAAVVHDDQRICRILYDWFCTFSKFRIYS